jgi:hypothetical protein
MVLGALGALGVRADGMAYAGARAAFHCVGAHVEMRSPCRGNQDPTASAADALDPSDS